MNKTTLFWICVIVMGIAGITGLVWVSTVSTWSLVRTVQGRVSNVYYEPPSPIWPFSVPTTQVTFMSGDKFLFGRDQREHFVPNRSYLITYDENWGDWRHMKQILTVEEMT